MIHLKKDRCGYQIYSCTGVSVMDAFQPPVCDNTNYDQTQAQRPQDNNFLNLPKQFQAVVQNVPFADLGRDAVWDASKCVTDYSPLSGGLFDAFSYLSSNDEFIRHYGDFSQRIQCYSDSSVQTPGILLPLPALSAFSSIQLEAIPTNALPAADAPSGDSNRGIKTGCQGFQVSAQVTGAYQILFSITGGKAYVAASQNGTPSYISVDGLFRQQCQGKANVENIQIYLIAGFDVLAGQWSAVIDWKAPNRTFSGTTPSSWFKMTQLATIKYINRWTVDVIQSQCSPVDVRDWVSEATLPSRDGNYVFLYNGNSAKKGWIQVQDCD